MTAECCVRRSQKVREDIPIDLSIEKVRQMMGWWLSRQKCGERI